MAESPFTLIKDEPFQGIDARSPENQIPPGYVRDALNMDVVQGMALGRPGYAGYAGNFPVRAVSVEYDDALGQICFTLDAAVELASIDLLNVRSSPLVVYGRLSSNIGTSGPFTTTDSAKYYPGFFQEVRSTFLTGTHTLTIPGTTHGLGTANMFVEVAQALSDSNLDNKLVEWTNININDTTFDITIDYTNGTGSDIDVFVYYASKNPETGEVYVSGNTSVPNATTGTITVSAATHQLNNFNIVARVYKHNPAGGPYTSRDLVSPEDLFIDTSTGSVTVNILNNSGATQDYFVILSSVPSNQFRTGSLSGSTYTITIPDPEKPFIFAGVYVSSGGTLSQVIPDEIEYDSTSNTIDITFQNPGANSFTVYWEYATIRSTQICVSDSTMNASGTDLSPQLTIWGLDQSEIYGDNRTAREGWATHIDTYRIPGESRVVGGLGGNLYSVREFSEAGTQYLYGNGLPDLTARTSALDVLAPLFWETGDTPGRTRGYATGTALGDNWATCTAVEYDPLVSGGSTRYDLTIPGLVLYDSGGAVLTTNTTNINTLVTARDQLTAEDMSYSRHNGTFEIVQVTASGTTISIWVDNPSITTEDWDDAGVTGSVAVFTDYLYLTTNSVFLIDDIILSDALTASQELVVVSSIGGTLVVSGATEIITIQAGVQIVGQRTSSVIPLRPTDVNFVRGDIVFYSGEPERPLRVEHVNPYAAFASIDITGDGTTATADVTGAGTTEHLSTGMRVILTQAGPYTGEVEITDVSSTTSFTFSSTETATVSTAVVLGYTLQIGEPITWSDTTTDTNTMRVDRRLIPVEAPDDNYSLTPATHQRYFDVNSTTEQPFIRSAMTADTLFLENGDDEAFKFDGTSLYRAGLFKWQPGVFIQTDTAPTAKIVTSLRSVAYTARTALKGQFTVAAADLNVFPLGSEIRVTTSVEKYTIVRVDTTNNFIYVDRALDVTVPATGTLSESATFRYYYRLNAVDQNNNVVASAVAQSEDYAVELTQDAAIYHKLIGFPAWDNYDYDALYVQAYRTKSNTSAPFYRVFQQRIPFNGADGYIEFTDTFRDSNLFDLDPVNTALKGQELGVGWSEPLRSKCITSAGGTAVLGNIRDYPQLDIQFNGDSTVTAANLTGTKLRFQRAAIDGNTTTDMTNRVTYEFVRTTSTNDITTITGTAGVSFAANLAAGHGLTVGVPGQWVYLYWRTPSTPSTSGRLLTYAGWWQVFSVPDAFNFTVRYTGSTAGVFTPGVGNFGCAHATIPGDIPIFLDNPSPVLSPDGNSSAATWNAEGQIIFHAGRRLALAINVSMRMVDTTISGYTTFTPWLTAQGGNDTGVSGRVLVRQPRADAEFMAVTPHFTSPTFQIFINDIQSTTDVTVGSSIALFPSRILIGYENFPEIFDNPTATLDSESDSAVDVNPSDGQEITTIVPFFGESAFGAAQQSAVVVVFKENSIYLVDINEKRNGRNPVQRLETEGIGCTAPNSVSVTKNGIMFANESGMYALRRNLSVEYVGKLMERQWERVDRSALELAQGHHYTVGRKYKLSVPITGDDHSTEVFVYDHTNEDEGKGVGAWTRYDNHPATGWCNLSQDAFFSSSTGRIFVIRKLETEVDYQDDHAAFTTRLQTRANDFGQSGARKVYDSIFVCYRTAVPSHASVGTAVNTEQEYTPVTGARIIVPGTNVDGSSDLIGRDVLTVAHSTSRRKGVSLSVQVETSTRLETIEIASMEFLVASIGSGGVLQAIET